MKLEQTIREYLPQIIHLSLGTSKDGKPWVCEVHFAYDDDLNLYFRSLTSRRHSQDIAANPNVAGTIVKQHAQGQEPLGVYFEGVATQLTPGDQQTKAYECLSNRFNHGPEILEEAARPDGHQFYKISVENWYVFGRLNDQGVTKHHLTWNGGQK